MITHRCEHSPDGIGESVNADGNAVLIQVTDDDNQARCVMTPKETRNHIGRLEVILRKIEDSGWNSSPNPNLFKSVDVWKREGDNAVCYRCFEALDGSGFCVQSKDMYKNKILSIREPVSYTHLTLPTM
jgi:hypothetical protein